MDRSNPDKASLVILTYNKLDLTRQCLESIYAKTDEPEFEVILVDNASQDGTPQYLKEFGESHSNVQIILNSTNEGFARGNNIGAAAATGKYLVFLNNDIVVTKGWLAGLVRHLQDPVVGMVGPVTNASGNESRIAVDYQTLGDMDQFAERYTLDHQGESFEIEMLAFYCVAMRRVVFEEVGPLDERFEVGMFEDDDYAVRLKQRGYKLCCAEDVFIHHWGSANFSKLDLSRYWYLFDTNRKRFEDKWGIEWQPHMYRTELIRDQVRQLVDSASSYAYLITKGREEIARLEDQRAVLENRLADRETELAQKKSRLDEIYSSNAWKLIVFLWQLRLSLAPIGSRREKFLRTLLPKSDAAKREGRLSKTLRPVSQALKRGIGKIFHPQLSWYGYVFDRFKRARHRMATAHMEAVRCPTQRGLVSIILPVYNGGDYLRESLDSILQQTYDRFELIVVDDGSTDETPQVLSAYEAHEPRLRVLRQDNQRLPRALSNGFRLAHGEFLTWTSADNRLKPDFLAKMVDCLQRHPNWDMVYANKDIIGEDGERLLRSSWYEAYQKPPGSGHVALPTDTSELNISANNSIGGAFMYRDRVASLLGDYSPYRFGMEDYDYWMRVNALFTLRHVDFEQPVYEYRFHRDSLTSHDEELGITRNRIRLMTFDDFRLDFYLWPVLWKIEAIEESNVQRLATQIRRLAENAGHVLLDDLSIYSNEPPRLWFPLVCLMISERPEEHLSPPREWPVSAWKVLISTRGTSLPEGIDPNWDCCITTADLQDPPRLSHARQGWLAIPKLETLCTAIDIQVRSAQLAKNEAEIEQPSAAKYKISVVISTFHRGELLRESVLSVARQSFPKEDYELIVVNNDPKDESISELVARLREEEFADRPERLRLIQCPIQGLSFARNAGISEARGEVIGFLDDDAIAHPDWLAHIWETFSANPGAGVVGGKIVLKTPQPKPRWVKPGWEKYWGQFTPGYPQPTCVQNWWEFPWGGNWNARRQALLEIGGFRGNYGRRGKGFGGGEELVAAILAQRLGYEIMVDPFAEVLHNPESNRYNFRHVWRTIIAGKYSEYNLQCDLYLPMGLRVGALSLNIARQLMRAMTGTKLQPHQRFEYLIYTWAEFRLLGRLARDLLARLKRPYVLEDLPR